MTGAAFLAGAGFLAGAVALFAAGLRGMAISAIALGLGLGAVASLATGAAGFGVLAALGVGFGVLVLAGSWLPWLDWGVKLLGSAPVTLQQRVFGLRSLRAILGAAGLFTARLLSGHLAAGTVATQGPAFACLFVFEVGLIRIGTGRGPADLGLGGLCAGMGGAAFLLLSLPESSLLAAALVAGAPALGLFAVARGTPWEAAK
ncbi:MAG: hypothetical protein ACREN7_06645 [Candidatus Dormibacteria bacterium]